MAQKTDSQILWIAEKLKRRKRGAKVAFAGAVFGGNADIVSKILTGKRTVSAGEWTRIAEYFGDVPPGFEALRGDLRSEDVSAGLDGPLSTKTARRPAIPLIAWVSAGKLADIGIETPTKHLHGVYTEDLGPGDFFATRVKGDSMNLVAPDGAIIIVNRRENEPRNGRAYIFSVKGETTFKEFRDGNPPFLWPRSTNDQHEPKPIRKMRDVAVVGRVRRVISDLP